MQLHLEETTTVSDETIEKIEAIDWGTFQEFINHITAEKTEEN